MCLSYTELRRYGTSLANHEIEYTNGDPYIPSGFRPITQGHHLIQEGSDNIDINAETVAGKNTFHSLARAVFELSYGMWTSKQYVRNAYNEVKTVTVDTTASLIDALSFTKPKSRLEPPRRTNALEKNKSCYNGKRTTVDDIWIITTLLCRDVIVFLLHREIMTQIIPFWTGYHCLLSE